MHIIYFVILILCSSIAFSFPGDKKQIRDNNSPSWLHSTGYLVIPEEGSLLGISCTATLVNVIYVDTKTILTAGHCVSNIIDMVNSKNANNVIMKPNITPFIVFNTDNTAFSIRVSNIAYYHFRMDGGDIALLELEQPVPITIIKPQLLLTSPVSNAYFEYKKASNVKLINTNRPTQWWMGGFSSDPRNEHIEDMTFINDCPSLAEGEGITKYEEIYGCYSFVGSSGGPVSVNVYTSSPSCWNAAPLSSNRNRIVPASDRNADCATHEFTFNRVYYKNIFLGTIPYNTLVTFHRGVISHGRPLRSITPKYKSLKMFDGNFDPRIMSYSPNYYHHDALMVKIISINSKALQANIDTLEKTL